MTGLFSPTLALRLAATLPQVFTKSLIKQLDDLGPHLLPQVLGRWLVVAVCLDDIQATDIVHLGSSVEFGSLDQFVTDPETWEHEDRQVVGDERRGIPSITQEDRVGRKEEDNGDEHDSVPCCRSAVVEPRSVWQRGPLDTLSFETLVESDVGEADTPPSEETTSGSQVGKVSESFTGGSREGHVGECTERGADDK